jgi:UDP-3-O-acyl N-acetylglucosamine deacetylase
MGKGRILIVDHDEHSRQSCANILGDDGFDVLCSSDGYEALQLIDTLAPDIVLLDLWLPGLDGLEILQLLNQGHSQRRRTQAAVIMMSGHGNIATAVKAIQMGAFDYVEKPLSLSALLPVVKQAWASRHGHSEQNSALTVTPRLAPMLAALASKHVQQAARKQRTLRHSVICYGHGLQSGLKTGMILVPQPANSGIIFANIATGKTLPALVDCVASTDFCTSLQQGDAVAKTIEHLLSTLHAYGITNLLIKVNNEVPIMDGSALSFCQLIEKEGIEEQDAEAKEFIVDQCYHIGQVQSDAKFILVEPYDGLRITYYLKYPYPLGIQEFTYEHRDGASYRDQIAPARTFAFVPEVEQMHELGLISGGRLTNVILIDDEKVVNRAPLRFVDECVRHKVLDIMGDLYLLGSGLRGHVRASMTGHTENVALVRQLAEAIRRC